MKRLPFLIGVLLFPVALFAQAPVITPSQPAVNQGATLQFTADAAGTWACTGTDNSGAGAACHGSINAGSGLYTAPNSVTAQESLGGFQLLPNNPIFTTDISAMPLNTNNAPWMATVTIVRN